MGQGLRRRSRLGHVLLTLTVAALLLLACATLALAAWPDLSEGRLWEYGLSESDLRAISQGYPDGQWRPDSLLSRDQFARMAVWEFSLPPAHPATPTFPDVPATDLFYPDVEAAAAAGLIEGRADGLFDPKGTITRQEAVAIGGRGLARLRGVDLANYRTETRVQEIVSGFLDGSAVSPALAREVAYAVETGLARGGTDGRLRPLEQIKRIQGAALLVRVGQRQATYGQLAPAYAPTTIIHTPTTGPGSARLSGVVSGKDGGWVFGSVSLMDEQGKQLDWSYITGTYEFRGLRPGAYRLAVYSPNYVSQLYGGFPAQSHPVTDSPLLQVGTEDVQADFVLEKGRSISGHLIFAGASWQASQGWGPPLTNPDGPWLNLDVRFWDLAGNQVRTSYMGGGESYVFWGLLPGVYKVEARGFSSGGSVADVWYDAVHSSAEATTVDITASDATDIDIYLGVLLTGPPTTTTTFATP